MFLRTVVLLVAMHLSGAFLAHDCMEYNASIRKVKGNGAGRVDNVDSAQDCRMYCQMMGECNAFIWNDSEHKKHPNVCWMKKGYTENGMSYGTPRDEHRHSGPKVYWNVLLSFIFVLLPHDC